VPLPPGRVGINGKPIGPRTLPMLLTI
jgi:hypothetical protein